MPWLLLKPSEEEILRRPVDGDGEHADLLRALQARIVHPGYDAELTISGSEWVRVQAAARNWRLGYERQFKALIAAGARTS